ncbi:MAG: helix-hairpin-helix domain-containing protein [Chthoniobacteraceae bacterium]
MKGENPFKIRAYTNAARALETFAGNLSQMAEAGTLDEIEGIGKAIAEKITELLQTGQLAFYEKLRAEFPPTLFELFDLMGLGPKKIKAVWEQLGVTSLAELEAAAKDGRVAGLPGFGEKTATNILKSIEERKKHAGEFRLGDAAEEAEQMLEDLKSLDVVLQCASCGSYRRRKEVIHDLYFLVATKEPAVVSDISCSIRWWRRHRPWPHQVERPL